MKQRGVFLGIPEDPLVLMSETPSISEEEARMNPKVIHEEYKEVFDVAHSVHRLITDMLTDFNGLQLKLFDFPAYQRIFLFILTRSIKTYSSILFLCEKGYGQDVAILLRSLLENLITVRYILFDKKKANEKAQRFVAYKWVIFKRYLSQEAKQALLEDPNDKEGFSQRQEMILQQVEAFKKNFRIKSDRALVTWSGKTIGDMARLVDRRLFKEYETTFRLCSRFSHPSVLGDKEYMIQEDHFLVFSPLPSPIGIVPNLPSATKYALEFLMIVNELFKLQYNDQIEQLRNQLDQIISSPKYQEILALSPSDRKSVAIRECIVKFKT